jgi:hypothetical protein
MACSYACAVGRSDGKLTHLLGLGSVARRAALAAVLKAACLEQSQGQFEGQRLQER